MGAARHLQAIPRAVQEATASVPQEGDQQERDRRSIANNRARDGVVDDVVKTPSLYRREQLPLVASAD